MLRSLIVFAFLVISGIGAQPASAQPDSLQTKPILVKFSLPHLLINGYHLDIEKPHKRNNRLSLIISPRIYAGKTRTVDFLTGRNGEEEDNARVLGYGAELQQRYYVSKRVDKTKEVTYLAYGLNLHHFGISFDQKGWAEELGTDGLKYYRHRMRPYQEKINRWGAVAMFGAQSPFLTQKTIWDIFIGLGYHQSYVQTNANTVRYQENAFDFGYTGVYFLAGFKIGVVL